MLLRAFQGLSNPVTLHLRADDLRRVLERPSMRDEMRRNAPPVPTIEEQAVRIRGHRRSAVAIASGGG